MRSANANCCMQIANCEMLNTKYLLLNAYKNDNANFHMRNSECYVHFFKCEMIIPFAKCQNIKAKC